MSVPTIPLDWSMFIVTADEFSYFDDQLLDLGCPFVMAKLSPKFYRLFVPDEQRDAVKRMVNSTCEFVRSLHADALTEME